MDKSFMVFAVIGIGFLYFVTTFVGDIQEEDATYQNSDYNQENKYDKYMTVDSIGQDVLDVSTADIKTQVDAWNASQLKNEFATLFPDFTDMKSFIDGRVKGQGLKDKLHALVYELEDKIISGTMTSIQAKQKLDLLK